MIRKLWTLIFIHRVLSEFRHFNSHDSFLYNRYMSPEAVILNQLKDHEKRNSLINVCMFMILESVLLHILSLFDFGDTEWIIYPGITFAYYFHQRAREQVDGCLVNYHMYLTNTLKRMSDVWNQKSMSTNSSSGSGGVDNGDVLKNGDNNDAVEDKANWLTK